MNLNNSKFLLTSVPLALALGVFGCSDDGPSEAEGGETAGSETAGSETSMADEVGDSGEETTTTSSSEESTTDDGCPVGSEGCPCTGGGGCDPGLTCDGGTCTDPGPGTTDTTTTDGGTDTTTDGGTDTTTDGGTDTTTDTTTGNMGACQGDESFLIEAEDADDIVGWAEQMSMLGEGTILVAEQQDGFVSWDLDIPCDDTWHVWVRGIDQGNDDSFFATVDGQPNPAAIFELDCTGGGQDYVWAELNYREQGAGPCEYLEDPWTQDWTAGVHNLTLSYRESIALSKIWITNTNGTPP